MHKYFSKLGLGAAIVSTAMAFATFAPMIASAHIDPGGCSGTGVSISLTAYRSDGTTVISGGQNVKDGETVKYKATLAFAGGSNCAFEGGTWSLTTPDGVVTPLGAVPEIGGAGVPSIDSGLITYVVLHANESVSHTLLAHTDYTGGNAHDSPNNSTGVVSGSTGKTLTVAHAKISLTPTGTNEIDHQHVFTATVMVDDGFGGGFVPVVNGTSVAVVKATGPGTITGSPCLTSGGTGSCTVTDNSSTPGVDTVNASSDVTINGTTIHVTTDGTGGSGSSAAKTWVDANIQITPAQATDPVNDNHVLTGHVNVNTGTGGYVSAPDGTHITFTIDSGPGSFVGGIDNCNTTGGTGSCNISITSAVVGTTVVSAHTTVNVGGVSLTRNTDNTAGDSGSANKNWTQTHLSTTASGSVQLGGQIHDTAHLTGTSNATTGHVTFDVYGPGDNTCQASLQTLSGTPDPVTADGDYVSANFTPLSVGTYRFIAHYSGDANNNAQNTNCSDETEFVNVTPKTPSITTQLSSNPTNVNTNVHDSATLVGASSNAGGTVTYHAYAGANTCSGTDLFGAGGNQKTVTNGTVPNSDNISFANSGTYSFQATYSGDGNNTGPVSSDCTTEQLVVNSFSATMTTAIHSGATDNGAPVVVTSVANGSTVHDSATLSFGNGPVPTGSVDFTFYTGAGGCDSSAHVSAGSVAINGSGVADPSSAEGPLNTGNYAFRAHWVGDNNYPNGATSACEPLTVTQSTPTLGTTPSAGGNVGVVLNDSATLSGASNPTGNIVFNLYTPGDNSCQGPAVYNQSVPLSGNSANTSPGYTSIVAGTYHWTADYAGDVNNAAAHSGCQSEPVTVNQPVAQYCSPGYWKQSQHFHSYVGTGYDPNELFHSAGGMPGNTPLFADAYPGKTLVQVLSTGGGGLNMLGRATVGALMNSASLSNPLTTTQVVNIFNTAFAAGTKSAYEAAASQFTFPENCPLN